MDAGDGKPFMQNNDALRNHGLHSAVVQAISRRRKYINWLGGPPVDGGESRRKFT